MALVWRVTSANRPVGATSAHNKYEGTRLTNMGVDEPLCAKATMSGYTVDGSFQQYAIAKGNHAAKIPKDVPLDAIAPILCAGITVYKGLKESGARPGQTVAIVGAGGGLGSLAQQYAKAMGLRTIAIDAGDEKKKMCMEQLGSYAFVDFSTSDNVVKDVQAATEVSGVLELPLTYQTLMNHRMDLDHTP